MDPRSLGLMFATICMVVILHFPIQAEADAKQIDSYCQQSDDPKLCGTVLKDSPGSEKAKGMSGLTKVALETVKKESANMADFFTKLTVTYPQFSVPLKECASYFKEAPQFLDLRGVKDGSATLDVMNAGDEAQRCETALAQAKANIPQVAPQIKNWRSTFQVAYSGVRAVESEAGN
ncbi:hypothetical protein Tsubulata_020701 [Turnera subulata]|uniref:Pectinesterase inhibitor domain-containing protein n=1 Tax=Turnera subulata TaxID=218843 RepID=A0A9Q0F5L6_9ROSI|nr:hypothetical protein Tsubulata_020701 [Turnera subulata]